MRKFDVEKFKTNKHKMEGDEDYDIDDTGKIDLGYCLLLDSLNFDKFMGEGLYHHANRVLLCLQARLVGIIMRDEETMIKLKELDEQYTFAFNENIDLARDKSHLIHYLFTKYQLLNYLMHKKNILGKVIL